MGSKIGEGAAAVVASEMKGEELGREGEGQGGAEVEEEK